jgi:MFS family permease
MISLSGTWMQGVAQAWLVLRLTGSGTALGLVTALQFLPVLLFGPLGGLVADRLPKRRVLYVTQAAAGVLAAVLGATVATGVVRLWMVYALAAGLGIVNSVDNPIRQTFVLEMVGSDQLTNAVTLNSVMVNLARVLGPAAAGVLIATVGLAPCFFVNAASYIAVLSGLALMRGSELMPTPPQPRRTGQLREGLRYVRRTPELLSPLLMMAAIGTLAYEFQVILPLVARFTFHGGAGAYAAMTAAMGVGAVAGGLVTASRRHRSVTALPFAAAALGGLMLGAALAPTFPLELAALVLIGAASITFLALGNTTLQLATAPEMRGRVMSLWAVAFLGSTPIGGPLIGWIGQHVGARYGLLTGGVAAVLAGALGYRSALQRRVRAARVTAADETGEHIAPAPELPVVATQAAGA